MMFALSHSSHGGFCQFTFTLLLLLLNIACGLSFVVSMDSSSNPVAMAPIKTHYQPPQTDAIVGPFGGGSRLNPFIWKAWKRQDPFAGDKGGNNQFNGIWDPVYGSIQFGKRQMGMDGYYANSVALQDKLADLAISFGKRSPAAAAAAGLGGRARTHWQLDFH